jgi:hypothetical protein
MTHSTTLTILFLAALLEAGGDALVRSGIHAHALPVRLGFFALGSLTLFCYGDVVNTPTSRTVLLGGAFLCALLVALHDTPSACHVLRLYRGRR